VVGADVEAGAVSLHGGDDLLGDAGGLEGDEIVGRDVVVAGLEVDGLEDDFVVETGFDHAEDGVVVDLFWACGIGVGLEGAVVLQGRLGVDMCDSCKQEKGDWESEFQVAPGTPHHGGHRITAPASISNSRDLLKL